MDVATVGKPAKPWSVKRLADHWGCSPTTIYTMIEEGRLVSFRLGKRGVRIKDEERIRWESGEGRSIGTTNSPSDAAAGKPSPTTLMKMVSAGVRG